MTAPPPPLDTFNADERPAFDFELVVKKDNPAETLGMRVVPTAEEGFLVLDIKQQGLIPSWNKENSLRPDFLVRPNDAIVGINGKHGSSLDMQMLAQDSLRLWVRRRPPGSPMPMLRSGRDGSYEVTLKRSGPNEQLGVRLVNTEKQGLLVLDMNAQGLIPTYNVAMTMRPDVIIRPGDLIVGVNGVSGNPDDMITELKADTLRMLMQHRVPGQPLPTGRPWPKGEIPVRPQEQIVVGATLEVIKMMQYQIRDQSWQLAVGTRGTVLRMDSKGDAEMKWEDDIPCKWLLRSSYDKVQRVDGLSLVTSPQPLFGLEANPGGSGGMDLVANVLMEGFQPRTCVADASVGALGLGPQSLPPGPVMVGAIKPDSWASGQGLQRGDRLLAVEGRVVDRMTKAELALVMKKRPCNLLFVREPGTARPNYLVSRLELLVPAEYASSLGFTPGNMPPDPVDVLAVQAFSWAEQQGVTVGDRLVEIDGVPVSRMTREDYYPQTGRRPVRLVFEKGGDAGNGANKAVSDAAPMEPLNGQVRASLPILSDGKTAHQCSCGSVFMNDSLYCRKCGQRRPGAQAMSVLPKRPALHDVSDGEGDSGTPLACNDLEDVYVYDELPTRLDDERKFCVCCETELLVISPG